MALRRVEWEKAPDWMKNTMCPGDVVVKARSLSFDEKYDLAVSWKEEGNVLYKESVVKFAEKEAALISERPKV